MTMAMMRCLECNGDVSSNANACPHCGAPIKANAEVSNNAIAIFLAIESLCSLILLFIFFSCIESCTKAIAEVLP